jgi:hypothetical protein
MFLFGAASMAASGWLMWRTNRSGSVVMWSFSAVILLLSVLISVAGRRTAISRASS